MATDLEVGLKARVKVPGSSANLGPGFDTLGLQPYLTAGPKEARAWTCLLYTSDAADE